MVAMDRKSVSFMYSFPNLIPLAADKVCKIVNKVEPLQFNRLYSAWWDRHIMKDAERIVGVSANRYIKAISNAG
jgi:hypothetical protein